MLIVFIKICIRLDFGKKKLFGVDSSLNNLIKKVGVFHGCQFQGLFVILELKFIFVNEHFKISKVTPKLALVKNAKKFFIKLIYYFCKLL